MLLNVFVDSSDLGSIANEEFVVITFFASSDGTCTGSSPTPVCDMSRVFREVLMVLHSDSSSETMFASMLMRHLRTSLLLQKAKSHDKHMRILAAKVLLP